MSESHDWTGLGDGELHSAERPHDKAASIEAAVNDSLRGLTPVEQELTFLFLGFLGEATDSAGRARVIGALAMLDEAWVKHAGCPCESCVARRAKNKGIA